MTELLNSLTSEVARLNFRNDELRRENDDLIGQLIHTEDERDTLLSTLDIIKQDVLDETNHSGIFDPFYKRHY